MKTLKDWIRVYGLIRKTNLEVMVVLNTQNTFGTKDQVMQSVLTEKERITTKPKNEQKI